MRQVYGFISFLMILAAGGLALGLLVGRMEKSDAREERRIELEQVNEKMRPPPELPPDVRVTVPENGNLNPVQLATVLVDCDGRQGSGVYTSEADGGYVLSVGHVHVDANGQHHHDCTVGFVTGRSLKPTVIFEAKILHGVAEAHSGRDFALMRLGERSDPDDEFEFPTPLVASFDIREGNDIQTCGFPADGLLRTSKGKVTGTQGGQLHASGYFYHGWSGGPAVDDRGRLVGLVQAYKPNHDSATGDDYLCYHYGDIREFVKWYQNDHPSERRDYLRVDKGDGKAVSVLTLEAAPKARAPRKPRPETPRSTRGTREEALAQCLTDKGIKLYSASWCRPCQWQKRQFGSALSKLAYVECDASVASDSDCREAGIRSYPTWRFPDGRKVSGARSLSEMARLSGCPW